MALVLDEEQKLLKETVKSFVQDKAPVKALRELRDSRDETGFSRELWQEMVDMGWPGVVVPEAYGGFDYGYTGLGIVLEECGRTLTASPLVSTVLLGATAIRFGGSEVQKEALLPAIVGGEILMTLALEEGARHTSTKIAMAATKSSEGYILNGKKTFVIDGHVADKFVVVARTSGASGDKGGLSLFLVDSKAAGVSCERVSMVDSRNMAKVVFKDVQITSDALLGELDNGGPLLEKILDIARIGLAAEMLGTAQEAFDRTINYLKERKQFGVAIGSFQALQHRAAHMFSELELCRSLVMKGLSVIDEGDEAVLPVIAAATKAKLCQVLHLVTNEAVQMFGGIGMTDEEEIGFFLKRARVAQQTFGDENYQTNRFAALRGY
jgi:alkylation response protein AidB-like acyl-CoA dehydrogenase